MKDFKALYTLLMAFTIASLTSCIAVVETPEYGLTDGVWTGDVGMVDDFGEPVYSVFRFFPDGRGTEAQYYMSDDAYYNSYSFVWDRNRGRSKIYLDYGYDGVSTMENVDIYGRYMTGVFYFDDFSRGFKFRLVREY